MSCENYSKLDLNPGVDGSKVVKAVRMCVGCSYAVFVPCRDLSRTVELRCLMDAETMLLITVRCE